MSLGHDGGRVVVAAKVLILEADELTVHELLWSNREEAQTTQATVDGGDENLSTGTKVGGEVAGVL